MSKLYEFALNNPYLKYLDSKSGKYYALNDLPLLELSKVNEKQLAFLYLDNSIESVSTLWSFWKSNFTILLLDKNLNGDLKKELESNYNPHFIYDLARDSIEGYNIEVELDVSFFTIQKSVSISISPKIKLLLSTSGTTGSPKLVKLSEENVIQNALSIIDYLPISKNDVTPLNLPLYYSYGFSIFSTNALAGGVTVSTNKTVLDKEFWSDFENLGYTSLAGVPYLYQMLSRVGFTKKQYPSLRYLTQAGGKMNEKLIKDYFEYCIRNEIEFYTMYGQTEATARISFLDPKDLPDKIGSIGMPIKNGQFKIDDITEELYYSGPNIFGGYAIKREDLSTYSSPKTLKTGDVAYVDEDGYYFIKGRIKRFVKLFGKRINLDDVENICKSNFENRVFALVGRDDKKIIVYYQGEKIIDGSIKSLLNRQLSIHPSFVKEKQLECIPLTSNSKIDYKKLKQNN